MQKVYIAVIVWCLNQPVLSRLKKVCEKEFILNKNKVLKKYFAVFIAATMMSGAIANGVVAAALSASTSLTIVHATEFPFRTAPSMISWPTWPTGPDHQIHPNSSGNIVLEPDGQGVYLHHVDMSYHALSWETNPFYTPYSTFSNTVNSMVVAVWSENNGQTFKVASWDYLARHTHNKHLESGMPSCWMGTMVHSVCDRKAGECNGRNRSNLYFSEYPSGNTSCWGIVD